MHYTECLESDYLMSRALKRTFEDVETRHAYRVRSLR